MTPSARHAAAIDILDLIISGTPAEKTLTSWARRNRYAGSKDRAAIRDLVFDILRKYRSCLALGGAETGRALVLGALRQTNGDIEAIFTGEKYAPDQLTPDEAQGAKELNDQPDAVRLDYPDWLESDLKLALGDNLEPVMQSLRTRAASFLRVNPRKGDRTAAIDLLRADGIIAIPAPLAPHALEVIENPRKTAQSRAYESGLVELQDVASQAVIAELALPLAGRILDYCAGGGGKALAMAASTDAAIFACDAFPQRMNDLPARAKRAGATITSLPIDKAETKAPYDLVFCDVPCSGSGAWRRSPASKWTLTRERLDELCEVQADILTRASLLVAPDGNLAYATCSLLNCENIDQVEGFLSRSGDFKLSHQRVFTPIDGGDGLYIAILARK